MAEARTPLSVHFAQGLLMGGADIIPGVSGGTMALIVGVYERLIDSISNLFSMVISLLRLKPTDARRYASAVHWRLIIPLGLGIATAIAVASFFIPYLLTTYPHQMRGLFLGLVAASIAVPWLRMGRMTPLLLVIALLAALAAFLLVGLPFLELQQDPSLLRVFGSASVAICAMILPGISGAFLLEVLGMYQPTTEALRDAIGLNGTSVLYVIVFVVGAATGLGLFSKVLDWLLENVHDPTMAALVGLMAGSLRALWPWQNWSLHERTLEWPATGDPVASVLMLTLGGFVFVSLLTWWGARRLGGPRPESAVAESHGEL